ncbi:MAG: DUF885 domain-containing protein [Syntrophorhabdus sp.]|nr:DUF885 domain-containing protein [Syntrophorhabdus sp.]HNY71568.1 DUF885 domain-containing protein [Syntrophorhabdus sp.]
MTSVCNKESTELEAVVKKYWEWRLREFPEFSTWTGDNRYNHKFTDLSLEAIERRQSDERHMLEQVKNIDPSGLSGQDVLSHALLLWDLSLAVSAQQFPPVMLLTQISGPQLMFPQLVSVTSFQTLTDYNNYCARLAAFPVYLEQAAGLLRHGIELGWVQPNGPLSGVPGQINGQIVSDIEKSPLYTPFLRMPDTVTEKERHRMKSEANKLITDLVFPAMNRFRDFITDIYMPAGDRSPGVSALPNGEAYYAHCVREYTTTDLQVSEIHNTGVREVERIRVLMHGVIRETGFKGSLQEFVDFLRTDPQFYFSKSEDLVVAYRDIAKRADAELPALFSELPRLPYGVRTFPDFEAPNQVTAMYYPGAADGSRAGYFMVNTYRPDIRPKYEMETLTLHEAVPGHHLQIARAQELRHLPDFRRNGSYTAFIEGWALYAESLGRQMGFYSDPYARFGQLMYEMWRACRLVVDTGIHSLGWSRQRSIDYIRENTAKTEQEIAVEVDRYIVLPGQALAYKVGELAIRELRASAEKMLGKSFDIRTFHNALLDNGPLPLSILKNQMEEWIKGQA